jgi:hypothetical protein
VLQKSSYNTAHANAMAQATYVGPQGAGTADDEIDLDSCS